jgi:transcription elongation factor GreA
VSRPGRGAADLLRAVGLLADGPVTWGRPVADRGPGLYLVELASPPTLAPLDIGRIGEWIARTPGLRVDGARPAGKELAARLAAFWLPGEPLVYAGATDRSIGGRVAALYRHVPGDRQPHADGQWLHVLYGLTSARIWWASTDAPDESLDAVLDEFAAGVDPEARAALADREVVLPFATTRRPTGERKTHGITGAIAPAEAVAKPAEPRVTELPPGDAAGTGESSVRAAMTPRAVPPPPGHAPRRRPEDGAAPPRRTAPRPAAPRRATAAAGSGGGTRARSARVGSARGQAAPATPPTVMTAEGLARLEAEHHELTRERRPGVVARIRAAKELGDLRENAEYHAAREEQSFLEGRVQAIEAILRNHVVAGAPAAGTTAVHLGSAVTVEDGTEETRWTIVGPTEADPADGRISIASPVGSALLGRSVGDEVVVRTPRGEARYRVLAIE